MVGNPSGAHTNTGILTQDLGWLWHDSDGFGRFAISLIVYCDFVTAFCLTRVGLLLWLRLH